MKNSVLQTHKTIIKISFFVLLLLNFICSPTARVWGVVRPISIKHGSLTILIYDTPTIIFIQSFNFFKFTLNYMCSPTTRTWGVIRVFRP